MSGQQVPTDVLTDRVEQMKSGASRGRWRSMSPIYLLGAITAIGVMGALWFSILGKENAAAPRAETQELIPPAPLIGAGTQNDRVLFSDMDGALVGEDDARILMLQDEVYALRQMLNDPVRMPEGYDEKIDLLAAKIDEQKQTISSISEESGAQLADYKDYIERLEARIGRLQPRPVNLDDSKWVRAQTLNVEDTVEDAARLAAPSMVFDASEEELDEEMQEQIEKRYRTRVPDERPVVWSDPGDNAPLRVPVRPARRPQ